MLPALSISMQGVADQFGQALAAEFGRVLHALPAGFGKRRKASLKPLEVVTWPSCQ
jgi:hypothetical protein